MLRFHVAVAVAGLFMSVLLGGCAMAPKGPHVRFVTMTPEQYEQVQHEDVVWFEFRQGDQVPMVFILTGMAEAATERPIMMRARRDFWVVVSAKDGEQYYSFDGKTIVTGDIGRYAMLLGADENGPQVGMLMFVGQDEDMPEELK